MNKLPNFIFSAVTLQIGSRYQLKKKCFLSKAQALEQSDNLAVCLAVDNITPIVLKLL